MRERDFAHDRDSEAEEDVSFGIFAFGGFEVADRECGTFRVFGCVESFFELGAG